MMCVIINVGRNYQYSGAIYVCYQDYGARLFNMGRDMFVIINRIPRDMENWGSERDVCYQ